ncbi:YqcC family protein [Vibrio quintilis]|nr:YqcC family protein [Vibrio quintilis]
MQDHHSITLLLNALEQQLRQQQLWQNEPPAQRALASQQPFAIDTLLPHAWLQWLFLPQMRRRIASGIALPKGFEMTPYFEEVWQGQSERQPLLAVLKQIESECGHA